MSRKRFGTWGADLDSVAFATAVAGRMMGKRLALGPPVTVGAVSPFPIGRATVRRSTATWRDALAVAGRMRFEVSSTIPRRADLEPLWLCEQLSLVPGLSSVVYVHSSRAGAAVPLQWPLDVGLLADAASMQLRAAIERQYWAPFVRFVDPAEATAQVDLLLLPHGLDDALEALVMLPGPPMVHTVLALGGVGRAPSPLVALEALRTAVQAGAAGVIDLPLASANAWLTGCCSSWHTISAWMRRCSPRETSRSPRSSGLLVRLRAPECRMRHRHSWSGPTAARG